MKRSAGIPVFAGNTLRSAGYGVKRKSLCEPATRNSFRQELLRSNPLSVAKSGEDGQPATNHRHIFFAFSRMAGIASSMISRMSS